VGVLFFSRQDLAGKTLAGKKDLGAHDPPAALAGELVSEGRLKWKITEMVM
jgi:hypothetical protein